MQLINDKVVFTEDEKTALKVMELLANEMGEGADDYIFSCVGIECGDCPFGEFNLCPCITIRQDLMRFCGAAAVKEDN